MVDPRLSEQPELKCTASCSDKPKIRINEDEKLRAQRYLRTSIDHLRYEIGQHASSESV